MTTKYLKTILVGLMIIPLIGLFFTAVPVSHAQSSQVWSDPVNLSTAGSSINPELVIDTTGTFHVIWLDEIDGYKYTKSTDGVNWDTPKTVQLPFGPLDEAQPVFIPGPEGEIHVLWQDETLGLYYSKVSSDFSQRANWSATRKLAKSIATFTAVVSSQGIVHVGYVSNIFTETEVSGIYYLQYKGYSWSKPVNLYSSQYFRSIGTEDANIRLAVSEQNELETVYLTWDDRSQKQIFMARSLDGGSLWESNALIRSSENSSGLETPYNINVGVVGDKVLLLWQSGIPGSQCAQYSQWSIDGGKEFGPPEKVLTESGACPQESEIAMMNQDYSVIWLNILDDISLVAWNGYSWSVPQKQNEVTAFVNPKTLDTVFFACQNLSFDKGQLFVVGCDNGLGRDIWFSSRSLGTIDDWFPSTSEWTAPVEVMSGDQRLSVLSSVADNEGNIHAFWVQPPLISGTARKATIQYARWDGVRWSVPVNILFGLPEDLKQLVAKADSQNRLLLTWVDSKTGDIFLSWANSKYANKPSEWKSPQYIPSTSQTNSFPDILVDDSGRIVVAYAIPINERRGMYFVESGDGGLTWTQQFQIFDAAAAGWDIVDQPSISLTGDGRLHALFRRYALRGEQGSSLGLYYSQSGDGGISWSVPEIVSEHSVLWNEIYGYDRSTVHRLWQENGQSTSTLLSFHQMSQDSGLTWSDPVIISSIDERPADLTAQIIDKAGNIHFLQLAGKEKLTIVDQMWNGSRWVSQPPKDLYISDRGVPSAITASISSKGNLLVSVLVDYPYAANELMGSILSVSKSLGLPKGIQTPSPVILAPAGPSVSVTEETANVVQPSSQEPSVKNIKEAPSWFVKNRNLIGVLLVGTILLLIIVIFRPISRKQNDLKKTS